MSTLVTPSSRQPRCPEVFPGNVFDQRDPMSATAGKVPDTTSDEWLWDLIFEYVLDSFSNGWGRCPYEPDEDSHVLLVFPGASRGEIANIVRRIYTFNDRLEIGHSIR